MKSKHWLLIIAVALQLLIGAMPFIPGLKQLLPSSPSSREQLELEIAIISLLFAILTALLGIMEIMHESKQERYYDKLSAALPGTTIRQLRDDEFYTTFESAVKMAVSSVDIMYLDPRPPDFTQNRDRLDYYNSILKIIQRKKGVRFNRIVRYTASNKLWIANLVRDLQHCSNASLCIIRDSDTEEMPLSLSTQIVDGQMVWFVAIEAHERKGSYRDLYVGNPMLGEAMALYFERIWRRGKVVLKDGQITPDGNRIIAPTNDE